MTKPQMIRAQGDGVEIQLADWPGAGQPVLCLHGLTANSRSFDVIARGLAPPHRVLAVDLRGRGHSDKPATGYSLKDHCRDLAAVITALGLKRVALLGHSLGAYLALALAARQPDLVDRIILLDAGAQLSEEQWAKIAVGIKPSLDRLTQTFPSFEAFLESVKKGPYFRPWTEDMEEYFRYDCEEVGGVFRSRVRPEPIAQERANLAATDTAQYYAQVRCPVLVLRATEGMAAPDDLVLPEEATAELLQALPQARLVNLTGTNHYSILFQPNEERQKAILDFLQD